MRVALQHGPRPAPAQQKCGGEVRHRARGKHERVLVREHLREPALQRALLRILAQPEVQPTGCSGCRREHRRCRPGE